MSPTKGYQFLQNVFLGGLRGKRWMFLCFPTANDAFRKLMPGLIESWLRCLRTRRRKVRSRILTLRRPFPAQTVLSALPGWTVLAGLGVYVRTRVPRAPPSRVKMTVRTRSVGAGAPDHCRAHRLSLGRGADGGRILRAFKLL